MCDCLHVAERYASLRHGRAEIITGLRGIHRLLSRALEGHPPSEAEVAGLIELGERLSADESLLPGRNVLEGWAVGPESPGTEAEPCGGERKAIRVTGDDDDPAWKHILASVPLEAWLAMRKFTSVACRVFDMAHTEPEIIAALYAVGDGCMGFGGGRAPQDDGRQRDRAACWAHTGLPQMRQDLEGLWWIGMSQPWRNVCRNAHPELIATLARFGARPRLPS